MRYAQVEAGQQLHLVYEAGEGEGPDRLMPAGYVSAPLGHACRNCLRVWRKRHGGK